MEYFLLCVALAVIVIVGLAIPVAIFKGIGEWLQSISKKKRDPKNREASDEIMQRMARRISEEAENE